MGATVVLGAQWGDEVKGKLVDALLAQDAFDLVARCAGGHNAGHTLVINGVKYHFHLLPSGLINKKATNLVGNGTVVHVPQFLKELKELKEKGCDTDGRIFISDRAHVLLTLHKRLDGLEEAELGSAKVGTTGNGIGPAYSSKAARNGIRVNKIFDKPGFDDLLRRMAAGQKKRWGDLLDYDVEQEIRDFDEYRKILKPFVVDSVALVSQAQRKGSEILIEGANAMLLDIDFGTFPYVTSSSTGMGGVFTGLGGIKRSNIKEVIGVVKAYTTRVGSGPFPTEQLNAVGERLQEQGAEFGTTTGRRRRCGWLDLCIMRYSHVINEYTALNLTKLDVLDTFDELKVAVKYRVKRPDGTVDEYNGESFPADLAQAEHDGLEIDYVTLPGWKTDITKCTTWDELPRQAKTYVEFIEKELNVPVKWVGVGPGRDALIEH
ncbi:Adenylosuccinate synthetase [Xylona heveae TC161]|uniref:Adenylosuccinate synthetase n=1 Tax=Xylona heveae (strain CBS 132557 / TC161) TaxID=1328760 RepID=A0A165JRF7_XYLHT|nr:Adenylosuccinate synthetase [Xylona heveae TC161]KZF26542.1 Adenylosuccinate synthetase [Xylona heveae TC161]